MADGFAPKRYANFNNIASLRSGGSLSLWTLVTF